MKFTSAVSTVFLYMAILYKLANNSGRYLTVDDADRYYLNNKPQSVRKEYESLRSRNLTDDTLPF